MFAFSWILILQAHIKLEKYKEAISDCEWALKVSVTVSKGVPEVPSHSS